MDAKLSQLYKLTQYIPYPAVCSQALRYFIFALTIQLPKMGVVASCGKTRGLREREANAGATNVVTCRGEVPDNAAAISAIIGREGKRQDDTEGPSEGAGDT